ncbi:MAG TPA: 3-isopropylmalate dehydratase small subunit [bacterium]|nr:3-isopropylmalate dehydratase small subunit [bacterium]
MEAKGRAWKFGDHVNTDDIIAAKYLNTTDEKELSAHCMETFDADFHGKAKEGDMIVAGGNFGCGSSREHAPISIKGCGISAVIAKSFARIFLRNSINIGLPVIELPEAGEIKEGDELEIDFENGVVNNLTSNKKYSFTKYPEFLQEIIKTGGLMKWVAQRKDTK